MLDRDDLGEVGVVRHPSGLLPRPKRSVTPRLGLHYTEAEVPKRTPEQRWADHVREQVALFRASPEFHGLRREGLRALGRRRLFTEEEWGWWVLHDQPSDDYRMNFVPRTIAVAAEYGLAPETVRLLCLVRDYRPDTGAFSIEAPAPKRCLLVGDEVDPVFRAWVLHEAWRLGIRVLQKTPGGIDMALIAVPFPPRPHVPLTATHRPPRPNAFRLRVETPPFYPPEAAAEFHRQSQQLSHELLRRLGYPVPERLRRSPGVGQSAKLRLEDARLTRGEVGDIADDLYGEDAYGEDGAIQAHLRRRVSSQRYRLRQRLSGDAPKAKRPQA